MSYALLAQEALTKWQDLDPARMERAVEIASKNTNIYNNNLPAGVFDVRASNGGWYRVDTKAKTCTCKDSQRGHTCKHRLAVWLHIQARTREAAKARRVPQSQLMRELGYT